MRRAEDLAQHVLLDMQTTSNGRSWHDWSHWFEAMKARVPRLAGSLRYSHYDQVVQAAVEGAGVAVGKRPLLLSRTLREGLLVEPLGPAGVVRFGAYHVVVEPTARSAASGHNHGPRRCGLPTAFAEGRARTGAREHVSVLPGHAGARGCCLAVQRPCAGSLAISHLRQLFPSRVCDSPIC